MIASEVIVARTVVSARTVVVAGSSGAVAGTSARTVAYQEH